MCYSISLSKTEAELEKLKKFKKNNIIFKDQNYVSGFTFPKVPILTLDANKDYSCSSSHWGLVPNWVEGPERAKAIREYTLNAKIETIHEKPSFQHLVNKQRCILPVSGFFEWRDVNKKKYPHWIFPVKESLFYIACLQDIWVNSENLKSYNSFTMLTTKANETMSKIHNIKQRMPIIFKAGEIDNFLDITQEIQQFSNPFADQFMQAHTIAPINKTDPVNLAPHSYSELSGLFGDI
jgi:putative SOS response-associated peptidase YedK